MFYAIVVDCHRRAATVVTSNRELIEWLGLMADPLLAQSAIDRLQSAADGVPAVRWLLPGSTGVPFALTEDHLGVDEVIDRTHRQLARSRHLWRNGDGTFRQFTVPFRYVWPSELDLTARIAGLTLEHRWGDWSRTAFDGESPSHVSVWRRVDV